MSYRAAAAFSPDQRTTELASFSTLLQGKSANWSQKARALKYELEYRPVEQERKRVATELHDQVLPLLSRLSRAVYKCGPTAQLLGPKINETVETIRDLLGELHPVDLEELGLSAALCNLCCRYTKLYGNRIIYKESDEEWALSDLQQVAVYRALQLVLRMFAQKGSGTLVLSCQSQGGQAKISISLRNSDHSAVKSLISEMTEPDLEAFSGWSNIAQMEVELSASRAPHSVIFSTKRPGKQTAHHKDLATAINEQSQARLEELESVVTAAQEEWAKMLNHDATVTGNMAVAIERQRLCRIVEELVYPSLEKIGQLALNSDYENQSQSPDILSAAGLVAGIDEVKSALDNVITATYPGELVSLNLVELIALLVERFKRATMINTRIVAGKVELLQDLALQQKIAAFRIIHEALHNVEKHSQATTLLLLVEPAQNNVVVYVEDNGLGIGESNNIQSRGIRSVKERAREIGATVSWQNSISYETGTLVTITLPIS